MKNIISILGLSVLIFISSCKHDIVDIKKVTSIDTSGSGGNGGGGDIIPCDTSKVYFVNDVLPIFISNCAYSGCHDSTTHTKDVVLDNYTNIILTGGIQKGNAWGSHIYESITETDPNDIMPPQPKIKLDATQINTIVRWINEGAINNYCDEINYCDTNNVKYSTHIEPIVNRYCRGCHSGSTPSAGLKLTSYSEVLYSVNEGSFLGSIKWDLGWSQMPRGRAKLSDCNIRKIEKWIQNGALNN